MSRNKSFPASLEKINVVLIRKKESKQLVKNCIPISLLPICGKLIDRFICYEVYPLTKL